MGMADLVGERLLLGVLGHLHGHVVRLLGHLRVVHGLRVGGARVAHLRRHRRWISRVVHGGEWKRVDGALGRRGGSRRRGRRSGFADGALSASRIGWPRFSPLVPVSWDAMSLVRVSAQPLDW